MPNRPSHFLSVIITLVGALFLPSSPSAHAQSAPAFDTRTTQAVTSALEEAARVWGSAGVMQSGAATTGTTTAGTASGLSGAVLSSKASVASVALTQASILVAAGVTLHLHLSRAGSIAAYGNPYGVPAMDIAFPLLRGIRARQAQPSLPAPYPIPVPPSVPKPDEEQPDESRPGRLYATYTRYNRKTGRYYSGRTSGIIDLGKDWEAQAYELVQMRHRDDAAARKLGFDSPILDTYAVGLAVNYKQRYRDTAYLAIRGREQQLIDFHGARRARARGIKDFRGGAWSDTGLDEERLTENAIRGVARDNPFGQIFHATANLAFGEIVPYTGIVRF